MESLCDRPVFTGCTVNGGFAEFVLVRADFVARIPDSLDDTYVAPLPCAGIIGFRSLRVPGVLPKGRVGLLGFGSSASLAIAILQSWNCEVYMATRGESDRQPQHRSALPGSDLRTIGLQFCWTGRSPLLPAGK